MSTFTVVGHGPSPIGRGLGRVVDAHHVIRTHDRQWQNGVDYGARTDYTIIPGPWPARGETAHFRAEFRLNCKPLIAWVAYTLNPKRMLQEYMDLPVLWFDLNWFNDMLKPERPGVLDVVPTRGAAGIVIAMELGAAHIRMLGCDSVATGKITPYAPNAGRLANPAWLGQEVNSRHDYARERDALSKIAAERNILLEVLLSEPVAV